MEYEVNTTTTITNTDVGYSVSIGPEEGEERHCLIRYKDFHSEGLNAEFAIPWDMAILIARTIEGLAPREPQ